jgi:hypothetical protein
MRISEIRKSRARKARPVAALESLTREIAIARHVIQPARARPELQQPGGITAAYTGHVTRNIA